MKNRLLLLAVVGFLSVAAGSCTQQRTPPEPEVKTTMELRSTSFQANGPIPLKYSSYGQNVSPELSWTDPPAGAKSLVLLIEDPDAPKPTPFVHWLLFNIPPSDKEIAEGQPPAGAVEGQNDNGSNGYYGPHPPSGTHHYHFRLYAVDCVLNVKPGATKDKVLAAIEGHTLGKAELVGTFSR